MVKDTHWAINPMETLRYQKYYSTVTSVICLYRTLIIIFTVQPVVTLIYVLSVSGVAYPVRTSYISSKKGLCAVENL